jgi:hypothetical protein
MPRTIIDIPSVQMRELDARCQALGISRAEGIRRAVHGFLNVKYGLDQEGFGLWTQAAAERSTRRAPREGKGAREGATRASHGRGREASPRIDGEQARPAQPEKA